MAHGEGRAAPFLHEVARAKVNLTLEIRGRRPDGYHELESLVAFTRFGDRLTLEPGRRFSLEVSGAFASALDGDNLIGKAAALYGQGRGDGDNEDASPGGAFRLDKHIPVAAGLGGGSADAAAALRLLSGESLPSLDLRSPLVPLAARLGADVPVCLFSQAAVMTGIGERLRILPSFPPIPIILVNPRLPLSTASVFRALNAGPCQPGPGDMGETPTFATIDDVLAYASARRNDLQPAAERLLPVITSVLRHLGECPGAAMTRLSGSGPTCFALFREEREAQSAATDLRDAHPDWWVMDTVLA